jgi:hypothetical protein
LTGIAKGRRWLTAAVFPLVLAACTSTAGRPGAGTGTAGISAGSGSPATGGLRAVRHVWVIELENLRGVRQAGAVFAVPTYAFITATGRHGATTCRSRSSSRRTAP